LVRVALCRNQAANRLYLKGGAMFTKRYVIEAIHELYAISNQDDVSLHDYLWGAGLMSNRSHEIRSESSLHREFTDDLRCALFDMCTIAHREHNYTLDDFPPKTLVFFLHPANRWFLIEAGYSVGETSGLAISWWKHHKIA
jgi:hypothetical protein